MAVKEIRNLEGKGNPNEVRGKRVGMYSGWGPDWNWRNGLSLENVICTKAGRVFVCRYLFEYDKIHMSKLYVALS